MAIKLIVDSGCDIAPNELPDYVTLLPIRVHFNEVEYTPYVDLTISEFYEKLSQAKELPHTSQVNCQDYCECIKPMLEIYFSSFFFFCKFYNLNIFYFRN